MIEGFRHFDWHSCGNGYSKIFITTDLFLFLIDTCMTFIYIPGLIAAILFHNWLIVGPMTILLFPLTLLVFFIMLVSEKERVFNLYGLKIRKHYLGFFVFCLTYYILLSPICVWGYWQEFMGTRRKWK